MAKISGKKKSSERQRAKYRYDYFPSCSKICDSMSLRSREYLRENTLHGFPYFVNPRRPYWERVAWFLCTLASMCAVVGIIFSIMETAWKNPMLTGIDSDSDHMTPYFPSVTLCQEQLDFDFSLYREGAEKYAEHYLAMYNWSWSPIVEDPGWTDSIPYSQIFNLSTPSCDTLYQDCTYEGSELSSNSCDSIFRKIILPRGVCCFREAIEIKRVDRPWALTFRTKNFPINVDLAEPSGNPAERDSRGSYYLNNGIILKIALQYTYVTEEVESMSMSVRKCLLPEEGHSYSKCQYNCKKRTILEKCGCLPWYLVEPGKKERECVFREYECLVENKEALKNVRCPCYLSCNHTFYEIAQPENVGGSYVTIEIIDWPQVFYTRTIRFGLVDLLVSFGGIAGLFLGYSVLTTVELVYYASLRTYCGAVLAKDNTIKIKVGENVTRKKRVKAIPVEQPYYDYFD